MPGALNLQIIAIFDNRQHGRIYEVLPGSVQHCLSMHFLERYFKLIPDIVERHLGASGAAKSKWSEHLSVSNDYVARQFRNGECLENPGIKIISAQVNRNPGLSEKGAGIY